MGLDLEPGARRRPRDPDRGLGRRAAAGRPVGARPHRRSQVDGFVEAFTGSHRFVLDYLVEEVLHEPARGRAGVPPRHLGARAADRPALRRAHRRQRRTADARGPRARQPVRRPARRPAAVVPLPPPVRGRAPRPARRPGHPDRVPALHRAASSLVRRPRDARRRHPARPRRRRRRARGRPRRARAARPAAAPQDRVLRDWLRALPGRGGPPPCPAGHRRSPGPGSPRATSTGSRLARRRRGGTRRPRSARRRTPAPPLEEAVRARDEELRALPATIAVYRASVAQARGDVDGTVEHARRALDLAGPERPLRPRRGGRLPRAGRVGRR